MKIARELTTVTSFSKFVALTLFIALPIAAFYFGRYYQMVQDISRDTTKKALQEIHVYQDDTTILEAKKDLSLLLRTSPDQIEVIKIAEATWIDTCLGGPRHSHCGVVTDIPGKQVLFGYKGKTYEYHTGGEFFTKISNLEE